MKIVTADITGSLIVNGVDVTNNVVSSSVFSGSIAGRVTSLEQFSASLDATFATDASVTASILVLSQSVQASQAALSSSYTATSASYLATSASYVTTSGSYAAASASLSTRTTKLEATASTNTQASASFATMSGSLSTRTTNLEATASTNTQASASFAAYSASMSTRLTTDETNITTLTNASASFANQSASLSTRLTTDETNFNTTSGSIAGRVTLIEGQYATTGSNTFSNIQYISSSTNAAGFTTSASLYTDGGLRVGRDSYVSGTAYFNNVVVYGTSSIQYLTSSQVNVGANIINLNTQTPAVRYGGMAVADSGSNPGVTGSMLWDSVYNRWIYSNPSGSTYDGGMLISGPRNTTGLGNELGTTSCALMMGQGGDHITSSAIFSYDNATCFYGNSYISGSGLACFSGQVCANSIGLPAGGTINNLANIQYGGYTWASYNTSTGAITLQNAAAGGININAGVACFASTVCVAGQVSSEDVRIYRSAGTTTGYINFGSTGTNYFGFDGTKYVANGAISATNGLFSNCVGIGTGTPTLRLQISDTNRPPMVAGTFCGAFSIDEGNIAMVMGMGCAPYPGWIQVAHKTISNYYNLVLQPNGGCVGIGITNPTYTLSVGGRGYFFATNQDAGWGNLTLDYGNGDNSNIYAIQMKEGGAVNAAIGYGSYSASSCGDIVMWANNGGGLVERMRIYANSGTKFYVEESSSNTNGFGVVGRTCSKAVYIGANCTYGSIQSHGSVPLYINELGNNVVMGLAANVGIGTANASSKLTVLKTITTCPGATGNAALSLGTAGSAGEYNLINFGYDSESWQPAYMGYLTTSGAGSSNGALVFATRSDTTNSQPTEKLRITSAGIANFACQICASASSITSYIGNTICLSSGFVGGSNKFIFANSANTINAITYDTFVIQADDVTTLKLVERNVGSVDQVFTMAVGDSNARLSTTCALPMQFYVGGSPSGCGYYGLGGTLALSIACSGISIFNCNVCIPKSVTFGTALFKTNVPSQGEFFSIQQSIGGCGLTAQAGGDYIHIKTNVGHNDVMVGFNVRGYMYSPNIVDTDIGFYTYSPVGYVYGVTVYNKAYTGWNYCLYYSSDNKVVLVVQGSSTYGGFVLTGINTARYNQMGEICILGVAQATCWCAQF